SEVDEELDDEFEEAMVVKSSLIGSASAAKKERNRYREVILKEVSQVRKSYDEILQNGIRFSRLVVSDSSLSEDTKSKIASDWQTVWESSDLSARSRELKDEVFGMDTCYAIPHLETAQMTLELVEQIHRLKCIYFYRVWKGLGRLQEVPRHVASEGTYDPRNVLARVNAVALRIQSLMKAEKPIWEPLLKVAKERGSYGGKDRNTYTSSVSGFQITRASSNWKWDLGAKNSPMRLSVNYSMKGIGDEELVQHLIQVNKVEFKWAETPEEIAQAWEQLAEYEWPNYQKLNGQFVEIGEGDDVQKVYKFRFQTRSPNLTAEVECHLFFPVKEENRGIVYGLLHLSMASGLDHHMSDEAALEMMGGTEDKSPFQVMIDSFRIRE
ncbi:MAG: hypothetical protein QF752_04020, partial [Planctomycetota bacterium]|nr:hypothetical protein [Planctomycetota bacterium]